MKCANPDCNRGIGLVAYRRGWLNKRRYCSKHCRDAFVAVQRWRSQRADATGIAYNFGLTLLPRRLRS